MTAAQFETYTRAYNAAIFLMETMPDLEPRSAFKQAAADMGIPYGPEMAKFVRWAERADALMEV